MDFTTTHYRHLLRLGKRRYRFATYAEDLDEAALILWRHDVDYSLNRALRLAEIEHDEGVRSTYFINPHCAFYNPLEQGQKTIVDRLLQLGHDLGVHLDAEYYGIVAERSLNDIVQAEARFFLEQFGAHVAAFSFHNPSSFLLTCDRESYGGLRNCYSRSFRSSFGYCSDSNGYWRFQNLQEVLESSSHDRLQVLTHPAWWQESPMSPRERIFRSIYGRASAVAGDYDRLLITHGRANIGPLDCEFDALRSWLGTRASALDLCWLRGEFRTVFVDVCRMLEGRLACICYLGLSRQLQIPRREARTLLEVTLPKVPLHRVLAVLLGKNWADVSSSEEHQIMYWFSLRDRFMRGRAPLSKGKCEHGIRFLVALGIEVATRIEAAKDLFRRGASPDSSTDNPTPSRRSATIEWARRNSVALGIDREDLLPAPDKGSLPFGTGTG